MKKFYKIMGIITGALFTCGIFFVIIGALTGGFEHTYKDNKWFNIVINPTVVKQEYMKLEEFSSMKLDVSTANINIKKGDEFAIEYALYGNVQCEVKNNTLMLEENSNFMSIGMSFKIEDTYVNIFIPEDMTVDIDKLASNMGNIDISDVSFGDANIEADMGNIYMENVTASDLVIVADMGNIIFDGEVTDSIQIDCNMGNVEISGRLACNGEIDADMGDVDIETIYDMQMYRHNIDVDLGSYEVYQQKGEIISGAEFIWNIDCDMGDVTFAFGEN